MTTRNRHRTRSSILDAACGEFAQRGFAGARIDEIAEVARVNKRMIYHYFGSKEGLYTTVLNHRLATQGPQNESVSVADALDGEFDPEVLRLMAWEALTGDTGDIVAEAERTFAWRRLLKAVRREQDAGTLRSDMDPHHLTLALLCVRMFPRIFAQYSKMILVEDPHGPEFAVGLDGFFTSLLDALRPRPDNTETKPRIRLKPTSRSAGE